MIFNFEGLCTLDMYSISTFCFDIGYGVVLQYRDIRISKAKTLMSYSDVHDIGAMSGFKEIEGFS
jgi:hypothetical protein